MFITAALMDPINAFKDVPLEFSADTLGPELLRYLQRFEGAISDDLNTAVALTYFEDVLGLNKADPFQQVITIFRMDEVFGLGVRNLLLGEVRIRPKNIDLTDVEVEARLEARKAARASKDYETSDRIRDDLIARGVEVMDRVDRQSELMLPWDWKLGE